MSKGIKVLPPRPRLALVFFISVFFIFINDLTGSVLLLVFGLLLFLSGEKRDWKLVSTAVFSGVMMIVYNVIFSPSEEGSWHFLFLTVGSSGLQRGLVTGLRLMGVMFVSFAWLAVTSLPEIYESLSWIKFADFWTLGILRGIQILSREFVALTQSLIIRGLKWNSLLANVKNLVPLATAIIPRVIVNSQEATSAFLSHQRVEGSGEGSLVLDKVTVRYSPRLPEVLRNVSLEVEPNSFVYLAGRNGAGKRTLLRAASGIIPWVMGEIKGKVMFSGLSTTKTGLACLSGEGRFIGRDPFSSIYGLTVKQELFLVSKDAERIRSASGAMGIAHLWPRETTKLSGGEQIRLVLAGALASSARILLLDCPLQELDPTGRQAFLESLATLRKQRGLTIVATDPFWEEFSPLTDRVIVLDEGKIKASLNLYEFNQGSWRKDCGLLRSSDELLSLPVGSTIAFLRDVSVCLGGTPILNGISLEIREGEILSIVGMNGSGKTTAMLTLAGAIKPAKGRVVAKGRVGYVFQNPSLQTFLPTVTEELSFGPKILFWDEGRRQKFVEWGLKWSGLDPEASPLDLHPAQARMLAIAVLNTGVSLMIFDEPTVGLDSFGINKIVRLIDELRRSGIGVIVVTHDLLLVRMANRVLTFKEGRIIEEGNQRV